MPYTGWKRSTTWSKTLRAAKVEVITAPDLTVEARYYKPSVNAWWFAVGWDRVGTYKYNEGEETKAIEEANKWLGL